jgi:large subunit ribosomal protein L30
MASPRAESGLIRITYVKSAIGYNRRQKDTVRSLGLRSLGDSVIQADSEPVRGMVRAVAHLVTVDPVPAADVAAEKGDAPSAEPSAEPSAAGARPKRRQGP